MLPLLANDQKRFLKKNLEHGEHGGGGGDDGGGRRRRQGRAARDVRRADLGERRVSRAARRKVSMAAGDNAR